MNKIRKAIKAFRNIDFTDDLMIFVYMLCFSLVVGVALGSAMGSSKIAGAIGKELATIIGLLLGPFIYLAFCLLALKSLRTIIDVRDELGS